MKICDSTGRCLIRLALYAMPPHHHPISYFHRASYSLLDDLFKPKMDIYQDTKDYSEHVSGFVQPVQGEYARFFGQSSSPGEPVLAMSRGCSGQPSTEDPSNMDMDAPQQPSASASSAAADASSAAPSRGKRPSADGTLGQQRADRESGDLLSHEQLPSAAMHFEGCLGDVLCIHLDLISILPQAVPLQQVTLVIAIMQVGRHHSYLEKPRQCKRIHNLIRRGVSQEIFFPKKWHGSC